MKKYPALLLTLALLFSLTACGGSESSVGGGTADSAETAVVFAEESAEAPIEEEPAAEESAAEEPAAPADDIPADAVYINYRYGYGLALNDTWHVYGAADAAYATGFDGTALIAIRQDDSGAETDLTVYYEDDLDGYTRDEVISGEVEYWTGGEEIVYSEETEIAGGTQLVTMSAADGLDTFLVVFAAEDGSAYSEVMLYSNEGLEVQDVLDLFFGVPVSYQSDWYVDGLESELLGGEYVCEEVGLGVTLDENWVMADDEYLAELNNLVDETLDSEELQELLGENGSATVMYAETADGLTSINIQLEDMGVLYGMLLDEDDLVNASIEAMDGNLDAMGIEDGTVEAAEYSFLGAAHPGTSITGTVDGIPVSEVQVCYEKGGYVAFVTVATYYRNAGAGAIYLDLFYTTD